MKKFIRSKMDHIDTTNCNTCDTQIPQNVCKSEPVSAEVQPPLPLDPPPLDRTFNFKVKREIDDSTHDNAQFQRNCLSGFNGVMESSEGHNAPICRDYIRGSCKRLGTCRYEHRYDRSQLVGLYTFCRDHQSTVCTYPNCKYVHASVFEEHHFYRTGLLPSHAFAHQKRSNEIQPPLPPIPVQDFSNVITNNSNVVTNDINEATNSQVIVGVPQPPSLRRDILQESTQRKRTYIEAFGSSPSDNDMNDTYEPFSKKCKNCEIMNFRIQYFKNELKKMEQEKEYKAQNSSIIERIKQKLNDIIFAITSLQQ